MAKGFALGLCEFGAIASHARATENRRTFCRVWLNWKILSGEWKGYWEKCVS